MAQSGCRKSSQLSEVPWLPEVKLVASGRQAQHHTTHVDFMLHMRRAHLFSALRERLEKIEQLDCSAASGSAQRKREKEGERTSERVRQRERENLREGT